jgi:hypothetical protein
MARCRLLSPEFFKDEELCALKPEVRLLFAGLWTLADKLGRVEFRPRRIKLEVLPYDDVDVEEGLRQLDGRFITIYEVDGHKYLQINNFLKYQKPHPRESTSTIPAPRLTQGEPKADPRPTNYTPRKPVSITVSKTVSNTGIPPSSPPSPTNLPLLGDAQPASAAPPPAEKPAASKPTGKHPDPIWDQVAELWFHGKVEMPDKTRVGKIVRDLKQHGATPDEIILRYRRYRQRWPTAAATPEAVTKHWSSLSTVEGTPLVNCLTGDLILEEPNP